MNFIYNKVKKIATGRWVIILLVLFILAYIIINGDVIGVKKMKEYSNDIGILDMELNYTPEEAYNILKSQGEQGRAYYRDLIIYQDFLFPIIYTLFWLSLITYLLNRWLKNERRYKWLCLIPILGGIFDYLENISILHMINNYPTKLYTVASLTNIFTIIKTVIIVIDTIIIMISLIGIQQLKKKLN